MKLILTKLLKKKQTNYLKKKIILGYHLQRDILLEIKSLIEMKLLRS